MKTTIQATLVSAVFLAAMVSCGTDDNGNHDVPTNPTQASPDTAPSKEDLLKAAAASGNIVDGKYYLSSGTFEGSDATGNKIDRQTLQIAGDYYWTTEHKGKEQYEVTATGSAKLSSSNTVLAELNCIGSQDVYSFDIVSSGSLRNFAQVESGCPQSAQLNASQQMSIRSLNEDTFEYTVVTQSEGVRVVETYIFRK